MALELGQVVVSVVRYKIGVRLGVRAKVRVMTVLIEVFRFGEHGPGLCPRLG